METKTNHCTLVSAFCNLQKYQSVDRPRDAKVYLELSKYILSLPVPMVLFIDPDLVDFIREMREKHCKNERFVSLTQIIPFNLEDSPFFVYKPRLDTAFNETEGDWPSYLHKEKDTPVYEILMWSKTYFLEQAIDSNPFFTDKFCWMDLGVFHIDALRINPELSLKQFHDLLNSTPLDKITCLAIHGIHSKEVENRREFYGRWNARTAGGLICGGQSVLTRFIALFKTELTFCMENGHYVTDEPIFSVLRANNRDMYAPFYGDYQDIFSGHREYTCNSHMGRGLALLQIAKCAEVGNWEDVVVISERVWEIITNFTFEEKQRILSHLTTAYQNLGQHNPSKILEKEFDMIEEGPHTITKEWWVQMQLAKKHKRDKNEEAFVDCCNKAWQEGQFSIEPLLELATYYFDKKDHRQTHECGKKAKAAGLSHPEMEKLIMIVSYYTGNLHDGIEACDRLTLERGYPHAYKTQGLTNLFWYVQRLPHIRTINLETLVDIPVIPSHAPTQKYNPLNPCILPKKDGTGYYLNCRLVNYYQDTVTGAYTIYDNSDIIQTRNMLLELDNELNVHSQCELVDQCVDFVKCSAIAVGLEDMRLFWYGDELLFSATSLEGNGSPTIAMGSIDPSSIVSSDCDDDHKSLCPIEHYIHMQKPNPARQEKNWIPFTLDNEIGDFPRSRKSKGFPAFDDYEILSIYSFDPFVVLKCDIETGRIALISNTPQEYDLSNLRGSSGLIAYEEGYLTVTHQITIFNNRRYYFHRFVYFEIDHSQYTVHKLSHPFYFLEKDVEFCSGMCYSPGKSSVFLTMGLKDREAHLFEVAIEDVKKMLFKLR